MTDSHEAAAEDFVSAIHAGDVDAVRRLINETPMLAREPLGGRFKTRTALHVVCDWPGYFPNGPEIVPLLIAAGANPDSNLALTAGASRLDIFIWTNDAARG